MMNFLLPARCPLCSVKLMDHDHICAECYHDILPITDPMCAKCGLPFDVPTPKDSLCGPCLQSTPDFDLAMASCVYGGAARDLILRLKHGKNFMMAQVMASMMVRSVSQTEILKSQVQNDYILTPVPLHWGRLAKRRFNQSAVLAQAISRRLNIPSVPDILERRRATKSQGGLGRKDRLKNVKSAFRIKQKYSEKVKGKTIILVDDVYTTGATVTECVKILKKAGAHRVIVICFARVVKGWHFKETDVNF